MKGSLNKGFLTYLFLFIGLVLAVFLILACILLFSPGTEILGFMFVSENHTYEIKTINGDDGTVLLDGQGNQVETSNEPTTINFQTLSKLKITSNCFDIKVFTADLSYIEIQNNIRAFTRTKGINQTTITKQYNLLTNTLEIVINDSDYTLDIKDNRIVYLFLSEQDYKNLAVEFVTNDGDIEFGGSNGINFEEHKLQSLTASVNSGNITLSKYITVPTLSFVNLSTKKGNINITEDLGNLLLSSLELHVNDGKLKSGNINSANIKLSGNMVDGSLGNITGNLNVNIENGLLNLGNVTGNINDTEETVKNLKLNVGAVTGNVNFPNATSADLSFDIICGDAIITTQSGNITVKDLRGRGDIDSESGDISVLIGQTNNQNVDITSQKGDITIYCQSVKATNNVTTKANIKAVYTEGLVFKLVAKADKIEFKNENVVKQDEQVIGYPGVNDPQIETSDILNLTTEKTITVERMASVVWA